MLADAHIAQMAMADRHPHDGVRQFFDLLPHCREVYFRLCAQLIFSELRSIDEVEQISATQRLFEYLLDAEFSGPSKYGW